MREVRTTVFGREGASIRRFEDEHRTTDWGTSGALRTRIGIEVKELGCHCTAEPAAKCSHCKKFVCAKHWKLCHRCQCLFCSQHLGEWRGETYCRACLPKVKVRTWAGEIFWAVVEPIVEQGQHK